MHISLFWLFQFKLIQTISWRSPQGHNDKILYCAQFSFLFLVHLFANKLAIVVCLWLFVLSLDKSFPWFGPFCSHLTLISSLAHKSKSKPHQAKLWLGIIDHLKNVPFIAIQCQKKQIFIDSSFTLLTVSFLTSWDVKVVIYDLLLPDPVRKATSSRSSLRYIASPPFISFIEQPLCLRRSLSHHRHLEPQLLVSVQSLCSLERNWVACFISFPRIFVPTISFPPRKRHFIQTQNVSRNERFHVSIKSSISR